VTDYLTIIRWTTNNPGGSPVHYGTVRYGLGPSRLIEIARSPGDVGALIWVAEQLDLIRHIDRACGNLGTKGGPSVGELAVAVAIQRPVRPDRSGTWRSSWMGLCRACRVCLRRHSLARLIIGWPGKSQMSNWRRRRPAPRGHVPLPV
jgi:hypothetical protein